LIAKLIGLVDAIGDDWAIIDVGGVGYLVFCSSRTLLNLPQVGSSVSLAVETHVREDHIHLYGFGSEGERDSFQLVTKVQGVGTKVALAILSVLSPEQMAQAVAAQDKSAFTRASGVGPKLGARIVTELKDKVGLIAAPPIFPKGSNVSKGEGTGTAPSLIEDAVSALVNLGFGRGDAFGAVSRAAHNDSSGQSLDDLIRDGLKDLSGDG
jgi:Holliday junction DNA helicase RuvA